MGSEIEFFSVEFFAAIIGAIVGGAISIIGQFCFSYHQERQHQRSLAYALFFKLVSINSTCTHIASHLAQGAAAAKFHGVYVSELTTPLAQNPSSVEITSEEKALVLSMGDDELMKIIISIGDIYNTFIQLNKTYGEMRIKTEVGSPEFVDQHGITRLLLNEREYLKRLPHLIAASSLASDWLLEAKQNKYDSWFAIKALSIGMKNRLGIRMNFIFKDEKDLT